MTYGELMTFMQSLMYVGVTIWMVGTMVLPGVAAAADVAAGKALYQQYCSACHGTQGKGNGPAAAAMHPKPRNHTDGNYMNRLSDDHLMKVISEGGQAVHRSPLMPSWKSTLNPQQIRDVIAFLRTLAVPAYQP